MVKKPRLAAFQSIISQLKPRRPFGRRRRGRRTVFIALGGVAAVAVLLILIISKPQGAQAAQAPEQTGQAVDFSSAGEKTVQIDGQYIAQGSSGAQPTINAYVTPPPQLAAAGDTSIPVLDAEVATPTPSPTPSATPTPAATPAATPVPSPTPVPVDMDELVTYYMVEADLYYNECGYSSNYYEYTDDDVYMLAQLIYGEARGELTKGKIAVANVVMNRVLSRGYPGSTIKDVITAPGQFSGYSSSIRPNSSCKSAARQVLEKQVWVIPQNVYFFNSDRREGEDWGSHDFYAKIGNHCFYTESYSGRSRNGNVPPALFERTFKWPQYGCKVEKRVKRLQYMLNKLGYDVKADGYFGMDSKEAFMQFQSDHGLHADGVAGPDTIEKLIKTFGVENYIKKYL
ncbi:MAG: cell wall hydrolase [Bacillota bacterium]